MPEQVTELLRHNAWANDVLYAACEGLTEAQLEATAVGTFGSIRDTLMHIAGAQERYVTALSESEPVAVFLEQRPFPGVTALREAVEASSAALVELIPDAPDGATATTVHRGDTFTLPVWLLLLQVINHATEHRAQVAAILTQQGIAPPSMDGWTYHETHTDADWSQLWAW